VSSQEEAFNQQRRDSFHQVQMGGGQERSGETAQILRYLSEIDDLPMQPQEDEVMGQLISVLTSTANLTTEEVRSNEWWREIIYTLWLCQKPEKDGVHGTERAWVTDDHRNDAEPLDPETRIRMEAMVGMSKLALTRSEDMAGVKEGTRDVKESFVHDDASKSGGSGGGLLGRFKG